jgi:serine/threonine protein phosphatase 1
MRSFVIGDIHGGLKALKQVLELANVTVSDKLIFLGDYVDGWSDTPLLLDFLIELRKENACIFIQGNHDVYLQDYLTTGKANKGWLIYGGRLTLNAYQQLNRTPKEHLDFLNEMQFSYIDNQNRVFVHAGIRPEDITSMGLIDSPALAWDRSMWEAALEKSLHPSLEHTFSEIYIGHTPTTKIERDDPVNLYNIWNLDTGAGFAGKLSMMDIDTKEVWQSDSLPLLYPNEKGRNE